MLFMITSYDLCHNDHPRPFGTCLISTVHDTYLRTRLATASIRLTI